MSVVSINSDGLIALMDGGWEHSSLYEFMVANHARMLAAFRSGRQRWDRLQTWFETNGLTDATGKAASAHTARVTWYRVRKAVARLEERHAEARLKVEEEADKARVEREARREAAALTASRALVPNRRPPMPPVMTTPQQPPLATASNLGGSPLSHSSSGSMSAAQADREARYAGYTPEQREKLEKAFGPIRKQLRAEKRWMGGDYATDD